MFLPYFHEFLRGKFLDYVSTNVIPVQQHSTAWLYLSPMQLMGSEPMAFLSWLKVTQNVHGNSHKSKNSFLGVNYTHIYCNNIYPARGSLNVLYIIFWDTVYIVYEQLPATAKGSCHMSRDVWLVG